MSDYSDPLFGRDDRRENRFRTNYCSAGFACLYPDKHNDVPAEHELDPKDGYCSECFAVLVAAQLYILAAPVVDGKDEQAAYVLDEGLSALEDTIAAALREKWDRDHRARLAVRRALATAGGAR